MKIGPVDPVIALLKASLKINKNKETNASKIYSTEGRQAARAKWGYFLVELCPKLWRNETHWEMPQYMTCLVRPVNWIVSTFQVYAKLFTSNGGLMWINSKSSIQSTLLYNPPNRRQLSVTTTSIRCSRRLPPPLLQQQILKHSQWQLVCHWSGRPKLRCAYSSCSNVSDEAWKWLSYHFHSHRPTIVAGLSHFTLSVDLCV